MAKQEDIAAEILRSVTDRLGDVQLTAVERQLLEQCSNDAAALAIAAMAQPATLSNDQSLLAEKAQINAQLANIAAALEVRMTEVFWSTVEAIVGRVLAIVFAAAV